MAEPTDETITGVRRSRPGDAAQIAWVLADAFAVNEPALQAVPVDPDRSTPAGSETTGSDDDPRAAYTWVAVEHGSDGTEQVVGVTSYRLRGQWFGGRRVGCAALSNVAVSIGHRGGGVGLRLVRAALDDARRRGAALTALIPSVHGFYERLDCGVAGWRSRVDLTTDQLRQHLARRPADRQVRRARPDDATAVAALVAARARRGSGLIDHQVLPVDLHLTDDALIDDVPAEDPSGPGRWVSVVDGQVTGWAEVSRRPPRLPSTPYDLVVDDLLGATPADETALWLDVVAGHPAGLPARASFGPGGLLERRLPRQIGAVSHETWMLALLDLDRGLADRGYPADLATAVTLEVTRSDGSVLRRGLRVAGGLGRVETVTPGAGGRAPVRLGAATLASLYSGHLDPWTAARLGLVEADPCDLDRLRSLFAGPPAAPARGF